jgi:hypothetical protein
VSPIKEKRKAYTVDDDDGGDMVYLLTAIGLSPGGSTHLHTNNTQNNTNNNRTRRKSEGHGPL